MKWPGSFFFLFLSFFFSCGGGAGAGVICWARTLCVKRFRFVVLV